MNSSVENTFANVPSEQYSQLLAEKVKHLSQLLKPLVNDTTLADISVYTSPVSHFRMRSEFGIWHEADDCYYTMVKKDDNGKSHRLKVTDFPIASKDINQLMPLLLEEIKKQPLLKHKLFQVEFLNTLSGEMLVTLIYHKKLLEDWSVLAEQLSETFSCHIIGRSRKQKVVLSQDFTTEKLTILDKVYTYKQLEGSFTQPNAQVCKSMLTWACEQAHVITQTQVTDSNQSKDKRDLLELYCGNANFTLPLSQYFNKVLATEISKTSVAAATYNIEVNHIDNISIARLSSEEFTQAKNGEREFQRLKKSNIELNDYDFSTVFVDPPRAGIDDDTLKLLAEFDHIIYISCNPETLADNLQQLTRTHEVLTTALFDQFPYTQHIESGVLLKKIQG